MRWRAALLVALPLILTGPSAGAAPLEPYRTGDWKDLVRQKSGQPLIVHFWGVTCSPCIVELPKWGRFLREKHEARVVFVEVDQAPQKVALKILADARLSQADNRVLASPFDEYMRFEVDPKWVGELPSTILIGKGGKATRLSGAVDFGAIREWLAREADVSLKR